ncbi:MULTISPECIES: DUF3970 family protein [Bacillus cereus group]|uniref:DUF3970 family protein n=1 Tax=Bacillus cereus group TaxID=86661 RepID=UPI001298C1A1|nr:MULTISPECIES: DUF3970 family protein [Bacillus cereus group]MCR6789936.1 YvzF family protein [Bacillus thuringiensis]MCR6825916.1 YvzF family protein [Bacillus thuringiensis]MCR6831768.1 YvzF family protein [Bacillus thuringiensis]MEB9327350.1 DUF3970 family protein [Bacillus cereus]MEB9914542.1 DUF3970 family protein [Bacillus cereus]
MLNIRVSGDEKEVKTFIDFILKISESHGNYEVTGTREPQKGNNPKYKNSTNVLGYMNLKSTIVRGDD